MNVSEWLMLASARGESSIASYFNQKSPSTPDIYRPSENNILQPNSSMQQQAVEKHLKTQPIKTLSALRGHLAPVGAFLTGKERLDAWLDRTLMSAQASY